MCNAIQKLAFGVYLTDNRLYAPEQNPQLPYRLWLIRLRDHRTPVDLFTSDDALARTVTFIH